MNPEPAKSNVQPVGDKKKNNRSLIIIVLLLLLALIALLIWFIPMKSKYVALIEEKEVQQEELQEELNALMNRHDSVKVMYGTLADSLKSKDSIIQANAKEIQNLLNYKWEYHKVNKKLELLRKISQGYVHQLDSLFTVNRELKEENERIMEQYITEQKKTSKLTEEKKELSEKMTDAAVLKAYNLTAEGIRLTGSGRERTTDKANKIEKVKVCFTLGENKLVAPGPKSIYMRIARPDNVIVSQRMGDTYTFEYQGQLIEYTIKKEIEYTQEPLNLCLYWTKKSEKDPAMVGKYNVAIFADGFEIGQTFFELQ
ncbi:MAG: hypothetical protein JXA03_03395 [Bacteroidales bacterium]|nr:hypothetical protein [Bacteroidales bacterium]